MQDSGLFTAARNTLLAIAFVFAGCGDIDGPASPDDDGTIRGIMRDAQGETVAGAVIRASSDGGTTRQAVADAEGTFTFDNMPAGNWQLTYDGSNDYANKSIDVKVTAGSTVNVTMVLDRISGTVMGSVKSTNGGVSGVNVNLTHEESNTHQVAITQGDGSFSFAEVPLGTVRLTVDPTAEAFTVPVVVSLQQASVTAPAIAFLPRSALRPIAYVRCLEWYIDWDDNEICAQSQLSVANSDGTGERAVLLSLIETIGGVHVPSLNTRPSFSPDGQKLVFSRGGTLHIINVDGTGLVELSQLTGMSSPVWSPDASRILFAAGQLYFGSLPDFDSFAAVPNTEGARAPALSPDGSRIAFVTAGDLKVVNADGSALITLTSGIVGHPTWSPDGQRIAFWHGGADGDWRDERFGVNIIDAGGGNLISLGAGYCPEWSPDGSLIAAAGEPWPTQAPQTRNAMYLNDVVVASLHLPGAISCTHAWSPGSALLP